MLIEKMVYKKYLEFTKQSILPDYVVKIMDEDLELLKIYKNTDKVKVRGKTFPLGIALIYNIVAEVGFNYDELKTFLPLTKKNLAKFLSELYKKVDDGVKCIWIQWMLQFIGFHYGTKFAASYRISDFTIPDDIIDQKNKIVEQLKVGKIDAVTFDDEMKKLSVELINRYAKEGKNISDLIHSGGAKNEVVNIQRMLLARGLSINSKGEVNKVVTTSLAEGHKPDEYVAGASEAITSQYHKSRSTAKPGYLVRTLNELLSQMHISEIEDCGSKKYFEVEVKDDNLASSLINRYTSDGKLITSAPKVGSTVKLRSPLFCLAKDGFCRKCLGEIFFKKNLKPGDPLLIVSTSIADALTASSLKAAHAGTKLNLKKVDLTKEI